MTKRVFISRDLASDSPFRRRLSENGFKVFGKYLVTFDAIAFIVPPPADWVFCYSSRSVDFFLQGLRSLGIPPDRYEAYAALGKGTARTLEKWGIEPAFRGTGEPSETAETFLELATGQRVLFPRAEQSRRSIQRLLEGKLDMLDLVVYRNRKMEHPDLPLTEYVVLTSPLNAQAYFSGTIHNFENLRIVAIGATTAKALDELGIPDYRVAEEAVEESLADAVLNWEMS